MGDDVKMELRATRYEVPDRYPLASCPWSSHFVIRDLAGRIVANIFDTQEWNIFLQFAMFDSRADLPDWEQPPPHISLDPREIYVWRGVLDRQASELQAFWQVLSPIEQKRARRFLSPQHQDRFIVAHGMVRHIISFYLNMHPATLRFKNGPHGKPFLANPTPKRLFFNLSHSQNLALLAVTSLGEIGVDLEKNRPTLNYHELADRIMSEEERAIFRDLASHQQRSAFLSCWTRKEALVKAHGKGLRFPLNGFSVPLTPLDRPQAVSIDDKPVNGPGWWMYEIFPGDDYAASLVVKGSPSRLRFWHFPDAHHSP